jgi:LmbE family N-acetylglucosaminyl deacetylase
MNVEIFPPRPIAFAGSEITEPEFAALPMAQMERQALFVGSHPDDIEIGAGGTLARMVDLGWDIHACIATDDPDPHLAAVRRREALNALSSLGVDADHVLFLGLRDSRVNVDGDTVGRFRRALAQRGIVPTLVFTHTEADSHNDHRAVRDLVHATLRRQAIIGFPIINSLNQTTFMPGLSSDITRFVDRKFAALDFHQTQVLNGRVSGDDVREFNRRNGNAKARSFVEPLDLSLQYGALDPKRLRTIFSEIGLDGFAPRAPGERKMGGIRRPSPKARTGDVRHSSRMNGSGAARTASEKRL